NENDDDNNNNNNNNSNEEIDDNDKIIIDGKGRISTAGEKAKMILEANSDPTKAQERLSIMSTGSQPDPIENLERRTHSRGPSFALRDMFKNSDDDSDEDEQSCHSAPESDYFA